MTSLKVKKKNHKATRIYKACIIQNKRTNVSMSLNIPSSISQN